MALTRDRNTPTRLGQVQVYPVAANTVIYAGALVALDASGNAVPGSTAATLKAAGRAEENVVNNPGAAGAKFINVRRGVFKYANSATDAVTAAHLLGVCYIEDDQTVAATDGGATRSPAGRVLEIETDGVWVDIGGEVLWAGTIAAVTGLVAALAAKQGINYITGDYGAAWDAAGLTTALNAVGTTNGIEVVAWNTNGAGAGRRYTRANDAWKYVALT
jgi:hypothetical protein